MNSKVAEEILMMHADALCAGTDVTEVLMNHYPELAPLLRIAQSAAYSYEMVPLSADFATRLHFSLLKKGSALPELAPSNEVAWMIGAIIGLGSAVTGVAIWVARRQHAAEVEHRSY